MDKRIVSFIVMILITSQLSFAYGADYGENSTCLGQVTDDYSTDDYLNATIDVVRNNSLTCMELNYSTSAGTGMILQDFEVYTESDEGNGITVVSPIYVDAILTRDTTRYIYYDFGVDVLGNYKLYGKFRQDYHNANAQGLFMLMSDYNLGDEQDHRDSAEDYTCITLGGTAGNLGMREYYSGSFYSPANKLFPDDTYFWFKLEKTGTLLELDVYTTLILRDAEGNGDWYDDELTLHADHEFRYLHLVSSHDDNRNEEMNMEIYDVYLNGSASGYLLSGHYYTENMMDGLNGGTLVHLTNVTLPVGTDITVEYSNDNATWRNHLGDAGGDELEADFYSLDLRNLNYTVLYQRFNLTTANASVTPRIHQSRIITTYCTGGGGGVTTFLFYPLIIYGVLVIFLITVGLVLFNRRGRLNA